MTEAADPAGEAPEVARKAEPDLLTNFFKFWYLGMYKFFWHPNR